MAHLGTGKPPPPEWIEFTLMDRFKWTPAEIRALPLVEKLRLLTMIGAENKVNRAKHG